MAGRASKILQVIPSPNPTNNITALSKQVLSSQDHLGPVNDVSIIRQCREAACLMHQVKRHGNIAGMGSRHAPIYPSCCEIKDERKENIEYISSKSFGIESFINDCAHLRV